MLIIPTNINIRIKDTFVLARNKKHWLVGSQKTLLSTSMLDPVIMAISDLHILDALTFYVSFV